MADKSKRDTPLSPVLPFRQTKSRVQEVMDHLNKLVGEDRIRVMSLVAYDDKDEGLVIMYPLVARGALTLADLDCLMSNLEHAKFKLLQFMEENTLYEEDTPNP